MPRVGIGDIRAAAERIAGQVVRTPLLACPWAPGRLWLKPESLQPTGAFKLRGALNALGCLDPALRSRGVVTHSSGNHAQAVAAAAAHFGVPATVVMPDTATPGKQAATRAAGAEVILVPAAERAATARRIATERGRPLVPPFDDATVIAGQGTVGLEIAADLPDVDTVLVPVGGGGLIAGVAVAVRALCPAARVVGVEPELAADAAESLRAGHPVTWAPELTGRTIADGLRVSPIGELPWEHIRDLVQQVVTVSEAQIRSATGLLARRARLVAEPSGAVPLAGYLWAGGPDRFGRTVAVVSGGNVDPALLAAVLTEPAAPVGPAGPTG